MPKQVPKAGDLFLVPLDDGTSVVGQVLETAPIVMNSITCAFFDRRLSALDSAPVADAFTKSSVLSCQFVTRDAFGRGRWIRIGNGPPALTEEDLPFRETARGGWVGAKVVGSGIMASFLNAYFGLRDWREMKDPTYYDQLLFGARSGPIAAEDQT